jgi:hypothetical protein
MAALTADAVIDAFWQSAEELVDEVAPHHLQRLLAGICQRLSEIDPSPRLLEELDQCQVASKLLEVFLGGESVPLAYSYSSQGNGLVELATFNAEQTKGGESGTVVGKPGAKIRFDEAEARRAVEILGSMFPGAKRSV